MKGALRNVIAIRRAPDGYLAVLDCLHHIHRQGKAATPTGRMIGRLAICLRCTPAPRVAVGQGAA